MILSVINWNTKYSEIILLRLETFNLNARVSSKNMK